MWIFWFKLPWKPKFKWTHEVNYDSFEGFIRCLIGFRFDYHFDNHFITWIRSLFNLTTFLLCKNPILFPISKIIPFSYHSHPFSWCKTNNLIFVLIVFIFIDINCLAKCKILETYRKHFKMQEICITWLFYILFKQNSHHKLFPSFFWRCDISSVIVHNFSHGFTDRNAKRWTKSVAACATENLCAFIR